MPAAGSHAERPGKPARGSDQSLRYCSDAGAFLVWFFFLIRWLGGHLVDISQLSFTSALLGCYQDSPTTT